MKKKLYKIFYNPETKGFTIVNDILSFFTLLSIAGIILETVESLHGYHFTFKLIEYSSVFVFTIEYLARIYVAPKKTSYIFSFFGIVDLLAIVPSYFQLTNLTFLKSARILRILRFLRILRMAKLARVDKKGLTDEDGQNFLRLNVAIYFVSLFSAIIILGSLIFIIESHNPAFSNMLKSMGWSAKILFGGIPSTQIPLSNAGEVLTIITRFIGLVLLGILINVVGSAMKKLLFGSKQL